MPNTLHDHEPSHLRYRPINVTVGARVRERRRELGMKLATLARGAGLTEAGMYNVEVGRSGLSVTSLVRVSATLRVSPDSLLNGLDTPGVSQTEPELCH